MKNTKTVSITILADVIGLLSNSGTVEDNLYIFDNNKQNGSTGHGTGELKTNVILSNNTTTNLLWNIRSIEPESFIEISNITSSIPKSINITRENYELGRNITRRPSQRSIQISFSH